REEDNGLDGNLTMLEVLGFIQVKFCLVPNININKTALTQNELDAFNILIENSKQLLLPQHCNKHNNYNKLYNKIIDFFRAQQQKLSHLSSSLEFSISQPWASSSIWNKIMLAIISLIDILKNYSDYLITTAADMNIIHYSDESARSPENNTQGSSKLESELKKSITSIQEMLNSRTEQLRLKNNKFRCYSHASQDAITEVFESIFRIDPTIKIEETTQTQICQHPTLIEFIDTHCQTHAYSFQPIRLPIHEFNTLSFLPDPIPLK
ncbi:7349_t:CDS:2, partial [Cetraspora pellucida]